jgi:hypothetical protein
MNHTEAIIEIKNIINPKFIKKIIPLINKKCNKSLKIDNGVINRNIRTVQGYPLQIYFIGTI